MTDWIHHKSLPYLFHHLLVSRVNSLLEGEGEAHLRQGAAAAAEEEEEALCVVGRDRNGDAVMLKPKDGTGKRILQGTRACGMQSSS